MPQYIRSDRGAETSFAADVHYNLSSQLRQRDDGEPLRFTDCFRYSTSKENSRIEAWWSQNSKSQLNRWRDYFLELSANDSYNSDSQGDRIAFLAVYIDILRQEVLEFVQLWNTHRIRKQPKRPYLVPGIPFMLYHHPEDSDGQQSGVGVPEALLAPLQQMVQTFGRSTRT